MVDYTDEKSIATGKHEKVHNLFTHCLSCRQIFHTFLRFISRKKLISFDLFEMLVHFFMKTAYIQYKIIHILILSSFLKFIFWKMLYSLYFFTFSYLNNYYFSVFLHFSGQLNCINPCKCGQFSCIKLLQTSSSILCVFKLWCLE